MDFSLRTFVLLADIDKPKYQSQGWHNMVMPCNRVGSFLTFLSSSQDEQDFLDYLADDEFVYWTNHNGHDGYIYYSNNGVMDYPGLEYSDYPICCAEMSELTQDQIDKLFENVILQLVPKMSPAMAQRLEGYLSKGVAA